MRALGLGKDGSMAVKEYLAAAYSLARAADGVQRRERERRWKGAMLQGITEGNAGGGTPTRAAYRLAKGTGGWTGSGIGSILYNESIPAGVRVHAPGDRKLQADCGGDGLMYAGGSVPLCDQAAVDAEAEKWAALWKEGGEYTLAFRSWTADAARLASFPR